MEKIDQSSKIKKRVEWNYLAAQRAVPTGDWLNERNIRVNVKCIFCGGREESVAHIFAHCMGTEDIREEGKLIFKDKVNKGIVLNEGNMIFFDDIGPGDKVGMEVISIIKQSNWLIRAATYTDNIDINPVVRLWRLFWKKISYES